MNSLTKAERINYFLFALVILLTRLPFLFHGYGLDGDSWSVALSAIQLHTQHMYSVSRFPGYPVHELLCGWLIGFGSIGTNFLSALFTTLAATFFALALRQYRFRFPMLAAAAMSFIPIVYIGSITTIDYNLAMAFEMVAFYLLLKRKISLAGLMLGLAIGCRITSGAFLLSFSILLFDPLKVKISLIQILKFASVTMITAMICYAPVMAKYGWSFFTYYDVPYPTIQKILFVFSIGVWGITGLIGLLVSTGWFLFSNQKYKYRPLFPSSVNEKHVLVWLIVIDLYILAFLKLPMEAGYLIPMLPFVIMFLGKYFSEKQFKLFSIITIASGFLISINPVERYDSVVPSVCSYYFKAGGESLVVDFLNGPLPSYEQRKISGEQFVSDLVSSFDTIHTQTVVVAGRWYNQLRVSQHQDNVKLILAFYLKESEAIDFYVKGFKIYFLPKQDYFNFVMKQVDLSVYDARPYIKDSRF